MGGGCHLIQVKILALQSLNEVQLEASGHAGYDKPGRDIVCAAFSMLWQNLARSVHELTDAVVLESQTDAGDRILRFSPIADWQLIVLLASFKVGVESLQEAYPEHVQLVEAG